MRKAELGRKLKVNAKEVCVLENPLLTLIWMQRYGYRSPGTGRLELTADMGICAGGSVTTAKVHVSHAETSAR